MTRTTHYPLIVLLVVGAAASSSVADSPFATSVVEFAPAPGQHVNLATFSDPDKALGPPVGWGTFDGAQTSVVSLGGFGGSITLAFDHVVEDDALNPFGMDAIAFGNAFWASADAERHWAECATIEIALDADHSGRIEAYEGWFLIPGSHITDPIAQFTSRVWDDDPATEDIPPDDLSWVPPGRSGTWTTRAWELPPELFAYEIIDNPSTQPDIEGIYGYAEYTPTLILGDWNADNVVDDPLVTPEEFYTAPDDPLTVGITPGSGGGDAFDIAWAVHPITKTPAGLPGFDFIRIRNPIDVVLPLWEEKSPDIDAVADVTPDPFGDCDNDGDIDLADHACFQDCLGCEGELDESCERVDREPDSAIDVADHAAMARRMTGPL
ncbi:MAG: hypothetical protein JSU63_19045 [Phycisphaerales bacterium]|nr:MAG: hypothetical protein JSU63_19045 [Phycisphaerales bacterium]